MAPGAQWVQSETGWGGGIYAHVRTVNLEHSENTVLDMHIYLLVNCAQKEHIHMHNPAAQMSSKYRELLGYVHNKITYSTNVFVCCA